MKQVCEECPHRKISEGGFIQDNEAMEVRHGHESLLHPCHMQPDLPCVGNARQIVELKAGMGRGDVLAITQTLNGVEYKSK